MKLPSGEKVSPAIRVRCCLEEEKVKELRTKKKPQKRAAASSATL